MKYLVIGTSLTAILSGLASAATTIIEDNSSVFQTTALTGFTTSGDEMDGMEISVTYADTTVATATWSATGPGAGAATSAGEFSLSLSGDTFTSDWTLSNLGGSDITGFSISAKDGDTVFDRTFGSLNGTFGSDAGADFELRTGGDATVTYSEPLKLTGDPIVGDLFLSLAATLDTPLAPAGSLTFGQDTDNVRFANDITTVPEPSTGLGIGLLLSAAFFMRRRK